MNKPNIPDLAESYVTDYERDYENDLPSWRFMLYFALFCLLLALSVWGVRSIAFAQENESSYPLRASGYTIPDNPYRVAKGEGAVWPSHEFEMTLEQQLEFSLVQGHPIPLETVEYLANTPLIICTSFCYQTGYVWFSELIVWSDEENVPFDNHPAIQVFSNRLFSDYYMIAVYDSFALGNDGNPHPRGFWWVKIEDFRRVFPEVE